MANVHGNNLSKTTTKSQVAPVTVKSLLGSPNLKQRFEDMLGKKAAGFVGSLINLTTSTKLSKCEPMSVISAAAIAATLDLPIDPNLGFAWIIPYGAKAQFQIGSKGFTQLALRTGQYKNINVIEVYEGQLKSFNPLTEELKFDFEAKENDTVAGYACFFKLINGFEKTTYWTKTSVEKHAKRFSKTYNSGPWQSDFNAMAKKTVLKNTLSKWGILSIEMQTAIKTDQGVVHDLDGQEVDYADNPTNNNDAVEIDYSEVENEDKDIKKDLKEKDIKEDKKVTDKTGDDVKPPWEQTNS